MNELFVDTGGWLATFNPRDQHHRAAAAFYREALRRYRRLVTTNLVVGETFALLRRRSGLDVGLRFLQILEDSPRLEKLCSDQELETLSRDWLVGYRDQDFSFVDAVSFALMKQRGLEEAFAFDVHFEVAGFRRLP
ncbi:MAG: PIN domain-containing protein [Armatimonadetes bacterium]|nr:PIN domain-containing protein [Armatimonadota bacterium]